ncbi:MAG: shikimate kinase [Planctomycetota bacterium]
MKSNVILIGMPGSGKSTVGVLLAKRVGFGFVDTDLFIQAGEGRSLQRLIEINGMRRFCEIECRYAERVDVAETVIATGGSVVYYDSAMQALGKNGTIVYLKLPLAELEKRLGDLNARGVVLEPGETLPALYAKRTPLYEQWADITVDLSGLNHDQCVDAILERLDG